MPENKYKLNFTVEAKDDLDNIFSYVTNTLDAPMATMTLINKIESESNRLTVFPFSGVIVRDDSLAKKGYRMLIIDNFIAFYLVDKDIEKIMRVVYGKRDYQKLL